MKLTGRIHEIKTIEEVGANNFKKRKLVLNRSRQIQYSDKIIENYAEITFLNEEKVKLPDAFKVGDIVDCDVDINGNYYTDKDGVQRFSQEIVCWKIQSHGGTQNTEPPKTASNVYDQQ